MTSYAIDNYPDFLLKNSFLIEHPHCTFEKEKCQNFGLQFFSKSAHILKYAEENF